MLSYPSAAYCNRDGRGNHNDRAEWLFSILLSSEIAD
jgi:hypothetical protein